MRNPHRLNDLRMGAMAILPMLIGVIPFGVVAGASPVDKGLGAGVAVGFSTIVFAGASQLAAIEVLGAGGTALTAVLAACTINLRMLLYSASLAPFLAHEPLRRRLLAAYVMTDQAYGVSIVRWTRDPEDLEPVDGPARRLTYYLGAGFTLWGAWQVATLAGAFLGDRLPDRVPIDVAVPLVFLILLVPVLTTRPAIVAAAVGGVAAVLTAELGAPHLATVVGAGAGIAAGAITDWRLERGAA